MPDFLSPDPPSKLFGYFDDSAVDVSTAHWKSLRYFLFYRFCIAWILLVFFTLQALPLSLEFAAKEDLPQFLVIFFYLIATGVSIAVSLFFPF